jgi:hypothetical protein
MVELTTHATIAPFAGRPSISITEDFVTAVKAVRVDSHPGESIAEFHHDGFLRRPSATRMPEDRMRKVKTEESWSRRRILGSFILPMVAESLSDGPGRFLQVICFAFPLIAAMLVSNATISRAIGEPTD